MDNVEENNCDISCCKLPLDLLDKDKAKRHFQQFGRFLRMNIRKKDKTCVVQYANSRSAMKAYASAGNYNGQEFIVRWAKPKEKIPLKKPKPKKEADPDWAANQDPEVQAELAALGELLPKSYNLRPEKMSVDIPEPPQLLAIKKAERSKPAVTKSAEHMDLYNSIKQQATSVEEKFKILDVRDKLLRLLTKKESDLTKAATTIGTCPDMCPEKERLMREVQHQVALYEQESEARTMNHTIAVKQYSRSSADQEVPLPHELRHVNVLHLTMGYLLHKIMDLCESQGVNLAEWFHFLWDRTRAIRKDITQQELCCLGSVELVEQCARFHIHCSARLVAEDPSVFDQKINSENLTKCLQTLKYMYHDLALQNVQCPNEAEFRAYVVLLNLNDGNFMWEVQNLRNEIKRSPQMRFAIQVYSALDKNNYVRFFKLVRSTTYLNACILLRYFIQVRSSAINLMLKCYSSRTSTLLPKEEITYLLAFEDDESTADFMEYYGLGQNDNQTHVIFDKHAYMPPEIPYPLDRATKIIESKRGCTVGEAVCGKSLPPKNYETHRVHSSFDQHGYLILTDKVLLDFESKSKRQQTPPKPITIFQQPSKPATVTQSKDPPSKFPGLFAIPTKTDKPAALEPFVKSSIFAVPKPTHEVRKSIFSRDVSDSKTEPGFPKPNIPASLFKMSDPTLSIAGTFGFGFSQPDVIEETHAFQSNANDNSNKAVFTFQPPKSLLPPEKAKLRSIFSSTDFAPPSTSMFAMPTNEQLQRLEEKRLAEEKLEQERKAAEEKLRKEQEERARKEREEQERKQAEERQKQEELQMLLEEAQRIKDELRKQQELEEMQLRKKLLEDQKRREQEKKRKRELEIQQSVCAILKNVVNTVVEMEVERKVREKKLRELIRRTHKKKVMATFDKWKRFVAQRKRKRKIMEQSPTWLPDRSVSEEAKELYTESQNVTLQCAKRYKCGKSLALDLPKEIPLAKLNLHELICETLSETCLRIYGKIQREIFWKISFKVDGHPLHVLKRLFGWKKVSENTLRAVENFPGKLDSFTYCTETYPSRKNDTNGLVYVINSLDDDQDDFNESEISYPIAVIIRDKNCDYEETACGNKVFVDKIGSDKSLAETVKLALQWLASKIQPMPSLELDLLRTFLHKNIAMELWERIFACASGNPAFEKCLKSPIIAVNLHNEAVDRLIKITLAKDDLKYSSFPEELKPFLKHKCPLWLPCNYRYFPKNWATSEYGKQLKKMMKSLKLPQFAGKWPPEEVDLESSIFKYCETIFGNSNKAFYKVMAVILNAQDVENVSWSEIVQIIVLEKLKALKFEYAKESNIFQEYYVVYNRESLGKYEKDSWFYVENSKVVKEVRKNMQIQLKVPPKPVSPLKISRLDLDNFNIDLDKALEDAINAPNRKDVTNTKEELTKFQYLLEDLEQSMEIQKAISDRFEETVKAVLNNI